MATISPALNGPKHKRSTSHKILVVAALLLATFSSFLMRTQAFTAAAARSWIRSSSQCASASGTVFSTSLAFVAPRRSFTTITGTGITTTLRQERRSSTLRAAADADAVETRMSSIGTPVTSFDDGQRPFQITTPIYYVNDKPHIGHAYTSTGQSISPSQLSSQSVK